MSGASDGRGADAASVLAELSRRFGSGYSSGVHAILVHENLPDVFDKADWHDWFFKPADSAFDLAHDMGLIVPARLSAKWTMTPLGRATARLAYVTLAQPQSANS